MKNLKVNFQPYWHMFYLIPQNAKSNPGRVRFYAIKINSIAKGGTRPAGW